MSEIESKVPVSEVNIISPEQIPTLIRSNQDLVNIWVNETVRKSSPYVLIRKVLMKKLAQGIPAITDFDALNVMMDFFYSGNSDHESFLGIAKASKLVETCRPSYKFMYNNWEAGDKEKASWEFVQERLLRKDNLAKAISLPKSLLFGLDETGNPLVANGGVEPIMKRMNYSDSRNAVIKKGWELFPYKEPYEKSSEIIKYEKFTGEPLVGSYGRNIYRSSWLESGADPGIFARVSNFNPYYQRSYVDYAYAYFGSLEYGYRGVRGLLRAKA